MIQSLMALSATSASDTLTSVLWVVIPVLLAIILISVFLRFVPLGLWITALASGVHVGISSLIGMRLRRIPPKRLVDPLIKAPKSRAGRYASKTGNALPGRRQRGPRYQRVDRGAALQHRHAL